MLHKNLFNYILHCVCVVIIVSFNYFYKSLNKKQYLLKVENIYALFLIKIGKLLNLFFIEILLQIYLLIKFSIKKFCGSASECICKNFTFYFGIYIQTLVHGTAYSLWCIYHVPKSSKAKSLYPFLCWNQQFIYFFTCSSNLSLSVLKYH